MKYGMITDESMDFEDLVNIKKGDVFYEVDMGIVMRGVATEDARVSDDQVRFNAVVQDFYEGKLQEARSVDYLSTKGLMHYGGKFYGSIGLWDYDKQEFAGKFEDVFKSA